MAIHRGLPVDLPSSRSAVAEPGDLLTITIKADGALFVDRQPVTLDGLPALLTELSRGNSEQGVLLFADRKLSYDQFYKVLEKVQSAGLSRISMQADSGKGSMP